MKIMLNISWMVLVAWCFLAPVPVVRADPGSAWIGPGLVRYSNPVYQGNRLDWCLEWGWRCGEPVATAWCHRERFDQANSWKIAPDIGSTSPTRLLQTGEVCDQSFCDGFAEIVCDQLERGIFFDFIAKASAARWTNTWLALPFPGTDTDSRGFVRIIENVRLEDGRTYRQVLETHPHWQPRGRIIGRYRDITIPPRGAEFRAEIGFLHGADASDGAYFEIWADFPGFRGILLRREYHKKYEGYLINGFSQDLSRFAGMTGTLALVVDAGEKSSARDWAVWVKPRLVSLADEHAFPSYVGGAIGSGRSGNRLLSPWGGKSGFLYGNVMLYLAFAHVDRNISVRIDSYYQGRFMGTTNLGTVRAGQQELWYPLRRTREGEWREKVVFNGTYNGDLRYTISRVWE